MLGCDFVAKLALRADVLGAADGFHAAGFASWTRQITLSHK